MLQNQRKQVGQVGCIRAEVILSGFELKIVGVCVRVELWGTCPVGINTFHLWVLTRELGGEG